MNEVLTRHFTTRQVPHPQCWHDAVSGCNEKIYVAMQGKSEFTLGGQLEFWSITGTCTPCTPHRHLPPTTYHQPPTTYHHQPPHPTQLYVPIMWFHSVDTPGWSVTSNMYYHSIGDLSGVGDTEAAQSEWRRYVEGRKHPDWAAYEARGGAMLC